MPERLPVTSTLDHDQPPSIDTIHHPENTLPLEKPSTDELVSSSIKVNADLNPRKNEIDELSNATSKLFDNVPEHSGDLKSLIEEVEVSGRPIGCPFLQSMGAKGIELARKWVAEDASHLKEPTMRELWAQKQAEASLVPAIKPAPEVTGLGYNKKPEAKQDEVHGVSSARDAPITITHKAVANQESFRAGQIAYISSLQNSHSEVRAGLRATTEHILTQHDIAPQVATAISLPEIKTKPRPSLRAKIIAKAIDRKPTDNKLKTKMNVVLKPKPVGAFRPSTNSSLITESSKPVKHMGDPIEIPPEIHLQGKRHTLPLQILSKLSPATTTSVQNMRAINEATKLPSQHDATDDLEQVFWENKPDTVPAQHPIGININNSLTRPIDVDLGIRYKSEIYETYVDLAAEADFVLWENELQLPPVEQVIITDDNTQPTQLPESELVSADNFTESFDTEFKLAAESDFVIWEKEFVTDDPGNNSEQIPAIGDTDQTTVKIENYLELPELFANDDEAGATEANNLQLDTLMGSESVVINHMGAVVTEALFSLVEKPALLDVTIQAEYDEPDSKEAHEETELSTKLDLIILETFGSDLVPSLPYYDESEQSSAVPDNLSTPQNYHSGSSVELSELSGTTADRSPSRHIMGDGGLDTEFANIETFTPTTTEAALKIFETIVLSLDNVQTETKITPESIVQADEDLQTLCIELFVCLGISFEEADVKRIVRILKEHIEDDRPKYKKLTLEEMSQLGTHEHKFRHRLLPISLQVILKRQHGLGRSALSAI